MNKHCVFCGNKNLTAKNVEYFYRHNAEYIIVNSVPCIVCDFCGEQYFEGTTLENIENLFFDINQNKKKVSRIIEVPIEDYSEAI